MNCEVLFKNLTVILLDYKINNPGELNPLEGIKIIVNLGIVMQYLSSFRIHSEN